MEREKYTTICERVRGARDMAALAALEFCVETTAQIGTLREFFLAACGLYDDDAALKYLGWLLHAISDDVWAPHLDGGNGVAYIKAGCNFQEQEELRATACRRTAEYMIELYTIVPTHGIRTERKLQEFGAKRGTWEPTPVEFSVLLKTKAAILTEVVRQWALASDSAEAERLLAWFIGLEWKIRSEATMISEVVKSITDKQVPVARLQQALIWLGQRPADPWFGDHIISAVGATLVKAIARNRDWRESARLAEVLGPINLRSSAALAAVRAYAAQVAELDASFSTIVFGAPPPVIKYLPELRRISVTLTGERDEPRSDQYWHRKFESMRDAIRIWLTNHVQYRVKLRVQRAGLTTGAHLFEREEELG